MLTVGGTYVEDLACPARRVAHLRPLARSPTPGSSPSTSTTPRRLLACSPCSSVPTSPSSGSRRTSFRASPEAMRRPFVAIGTVRYVGQPVVAVIAEDRATGRRRRRPRRRRLRPAPRRRRSGGGRRRRGRCCSPMPARTSCSGSPRSTRPTSAGCEVVVARAHREPAHDGGADRDPLGRRLLDRRRPPRPLLGVPGRAPDRATCSPPSTASSPRRSASSCPTWAAGSARSRATYPEELALGLLRAARSAARCAGPRPAPRTWSAMPQGRGQVQHASSAAPRDGRITAYQLDVVQDAGAYPLIGAVLPAMTMRMTHRRLRHRQRAASRASSVVTNTVSTTAFRGAGRPEAAVAIERMVDRFAAEIGMDPAEVRRRNFVPRFIEPYTTGVGTIYDVGDYPRGARAGARRRRLRRAARRAGAPPGRGRPGGCSASGSRSTSRSPPARRAASSAPSSCSTAGGIRVRSGVDAVRSGPRHHLGDDRGRPHRRADRGHRGRARRHRRGAARAASPSAPARCRSAGAAIASPPAKLVDAGPASGPPTCSRRPPTTSCSTPDRAASTSPARPARSSTGPTWRGPTASR